MKYRIIILYLCIFTSYGLHSQPSGFVGISKTAIGKNHITGENLNSYYYSFNDNIDDYSIDTVLNYAFLLLRGTRRNEAYLDNYGSIVAVDLNNRTIKWQKKINFRTHSFDFINDQIVYRKNGNSYIINKETGETETTIKRMYLFYLDTQKGLCLAFHSKYTSEVSRIIKAVDIRSGEVKWEKNIPTEYSINEVRELNDSVLLFSASGLHSVNINTGKGWNYYLITGEKNYSHLNDFVYKGSSDGLCPIRGNISYDPYLLYGVVSDVMFDSSEVFLAARDRILCVDHNGKTKWVSFLHSDLTSRSSIFRSDSVLYCINRGFAHYMHRNVFYGTPYIAAYNICNGKLFYNQLINRKDDYVKDFLVDSNNLYILSKEHIALYSLDSGKIISEIAISRGKYGETRTLLPARQLYFKEDHLLKNISAFDSSKVFIYSEKNEILTCGIENNMILQYDADQFFSPFVRYGEYEYYCNNDSMLIYINTKLAAEFSILNSPQIIHNSLFSIKNNVLSVICIRSVTDGTHKNAGH